MFSQPQLFLPTSFGSNVGIYQCCRTGSFRTTLLLIHGFGDCSLNWAAIVPDLSRTYNVVCVDLPGHGVSEWSEKKNYRSTSLSEAVMSVLQKLQIDNLIVIGHSLGAEVGIHLAAALKTRLLKLVLVDFSTEAPSLALSEIRENIREGYGPHRSPSVYAELLQRRHPLASEDLLETIAMGSLRELDGDFYLKFDPKLLPARGLSQDAIIEEKAAKIEVMLEAVTAPTLILKGIGSSILSKSSLLRMQRLIRARCDAIVVPGAGHNIQLDNPSGLLVELRKFLESS